MQAVKQFFGQFFERYALRLMLLFLVINWILLATIEKLGPPDFYKLHQVAENLFAGNFKTAIIPPLFPLLLFPLGKLLSLFIPAAEAFIWAGRLISLAAALGAVFFSHAILKKITGKAADLGTLLMIISPWFLKLLAFPITDMLYLCFVSAAFYAFLDKSSTKLSVSAVICGVITRFEGVLLILSGLINFFKLKKKYFYIFLAALPVTLIGFRLAAPRIFAHLTDIILPRKSYLFIFQHPMEFFNVLYGNILFFIPHGFPYPIKLAALIIVFVFFLYGMVRLFKFNRGFAFSLLAYEILFMVAKGYIDTAAPEREFRRIFSGLWIFYLVTFIGGCFLFRLLLKHPGFQKIIPRRPLGFVTSVLLFLVSLGLTVQLYFVSHGQTDEYIRAYANKAAYAAANWMRLNYKRLKDGAVVLAYTDNLMVDYYLKNQNPPLTGIRRVDFTVPLRYNTDENRDRYLELFLGLLKEHRVDYIIFDNYVVQKPEFWGYNDVKRLLYEERENTGRFKLKNLFYKGRNVAYVLRPVQVPAPR